MKKKWLIVLLSAFMALSLALSACNVTLPKKGSTPSTQTAAFSETDAQLNLTEDYLRESGYDASDDTITVIVETKSKSLAEQYLSSNTNLSFGDYVVTDQAEQAETKLLEEHLAVQSLLKRTGYSVFGQSYTKLLNGFVMQIKASDYVELQKNKYISSVNLAVKYTVPESKTVAAVKEVATETFNADGEYDGSGKFVAIIDTGLDYQLPAFSADNLKEESKVITDSLIQDMMPALNAYARTFSARKQLVSDRTLGEGSSAYGTRNYANNLNTFYNDKIVYGFDYGNNDCDIRPLSYTMSYAQHGTHVTGIATGSKTDRSDDPELEAKEALYAGGVIPQAQLAFMKVFYESYGQPLYSLETDIASALEDAITIDVDAINLSLGVPNGFSLNENNVVYRCIEMLYDLGVNAVAAVGNSLFSSYGGYTSDLPKAANIDYGTIGSPATYDSTFSVASNDGETGLSSYIDFAGYKAIITELDGHNFRNELKGENDWVFVEGEGHLSQINAAGGKDKIVIIKQSETLSLKDQYINAYRAGAKGVITFNDEYRVVEKVSVNKFYIPMCAISRYDAESILATSKSGKISLDENTQASAGISYYSSWGPSSSLKLGVDVTAPGNMIYSTMPSFEAYDTYLKDDRLSYDYGYYSGTSMSAPRVFGETVKMEQYLEKAYPNLSGIKKVDFLRTLMMSTSEPIVDINGNIESPRVQGSGLYNFANAIATKAYLTVDGVNKPKVELGDDKNKTGVYNITFNVVNDSTANLAYTLSTSVLTDRLCADEKYISGVSHSLNGSAISYKAFGDGSVNGENLTVEAGGTLTVVATVVISDTDREYLEKFPNGAYVDGFVRLMSSSQPDLTLPYLAFYGDWSKAPVVDVSMYDNVETDSYSSLVLGAYNYGNSTQVLGAYLYELPEGYEDIPEFSYDKIAVSPNNLGNGFFNVSAIYTGLLRNAERMRYTVINKDSGAFVLDYDATNVAKTYFVEGGSSFPVRQGFSLAGVSFANNTRLQITVAAELGYDDNPSQCDEWSFPIFIDDEAPVLQKGSEVYQEDGKVFLKLNVYENHFLNCIWLCSVDFESGTLNPIIAPIPIYEWESLTSNEVIIDISDYYEYFQEEDFLGVFLEDCVMNRSGYTFDITDIYYRPEEPQAETATSFECVDAVNIEIGYIGDLRVVTDPIGCEYTVTSQNPDIVEIIDNQPVGKAEGNTTLEIRAGSMVKTCEAFVYQDLSEYTFELITEDNKAYESTYPNANANVGTYRLTRYTGNADYLILPSEYNGKPVTEIYQNSFPYSYSTISIYMPDTYNTIFGTGYTFSGMYNLRSIRLSENLCNIQQYDFSQVTTLESIYIPASVREISSQAFEYCTSLKSIIIGEGSALKVIGEYAFFMCSALTEISLPLGLESIGGYAFQYTSLVDVVIPDSVRNTDWRCSSGGQFKDVYTLKSVHISASLPTLANDMFANCLSLTTITGMNSLTTIGERVFQNCISLKTFNSPAPLATISAAAFRGCTSLVSISFGPSVRTLGENAFANCTNLSTVEFHIATNITSFGANVFGETAVKGFIVPENNAFMAVDAQGALYSKVNGVLTKLIIIPSGYIGSFSLPATVTEINNYAVYKVIGLSEFNIPSGSALTKIGMRAFDGCTSMTTLTLENAMRLKTLGTYCFMDCTSLKEAHFRAIINVIPQSAFANCTSLTKVTLPISVKTIAASCFANCTSLIGTTDDGMIIPATVTSLGAGAFAGCTSLKAFDASAATANISMGSNLLNSCTSLESVKLSSYQTVMPSLYNCNSLTSVDLSNTKIKTIGNEAFALCLDMAEVKLPDTVTSINSLAFGACISLESIDIPASVTLIGSRAFQECISLKHVNFLKDGDGNASLKQISTGAFAYTAIESITIPGSMDRWNGYSGLSLTAASFANALELKEVIIEENEFYGVDEYGMVYMKEYRPTDTSFYEAEMLCWPAARECDNYVIPEMFISIPMEMFVFNTGLKKITIPATITSIGSGAFAYSKIEEVVFDENCAIDLSMEYSIFEGCTNLKTVVLPKYLESLGVSTFYGCTSLRQIDLPETLTFIDDLCFASSGLRTIDLKNVETIGRAAFGDCAYITDLHIPASLTYIAFYAGYNAFGGCIALNNITVAENNPAYKSVDGVLYDKLGMELLIYPARKDGTTYTVPMGVTRVAEDAFAGNEKLQSIILPSTLKAIGDMAFFGCTNLKNYVFLCEKAPLLEVASYVETIVVDNSEYYNLVIAYRNFYANLVDIVENNVELTIYLPDGHTGYDTMFYDMYFSTFKSVSDWGNIPEDDYDFKDIEIPEVSEEVPSEFEAFVAYVKESVTAYADQLKGQCSEESKTQLDKIVSTFVAKIDYFIAEQVYSAKEVKVAYEACIADLDNVTTLSDELEEYRWEHIYKFSQEVERFRVANTYTDTYYAKLRSILTKACYAIGGSTTISLIDEYYEFFMNSIEGVPTASEVEAFEEAKAETVSFVEGLRKNCNDTEYTQEGVKYLDGLAAEYTQIFENCWSAFEIQYWVEQAIIDFAAVVKATNMQSLNASRQYALDAIALNQADYSNANWLVIKPIMDEAIALINNEFIVSRINEYAMSALAGYVNIATKAEEEKYMFADSLTYVTVVYDFDSRLDGDALAYANALLKEGIEKIYLSAEPVKVYEEYAAALWEVYYNCNTTVMVYKELRKAWADAEAYNHAELNDLVAASKKVASQYSALRFDNGSVFEELLSELNKNTSPIILSLTKEAALKNVEGLRSTFVAYDYSEADAEEIEGLIVAFTAYVNSTDVNDIEAAYGKLLEDIAGYNKLEVAASRQGKLDELKGYYDTLVLTEYFSGDASAITLAYEQAQTDMAQTRTNNLDELISEFKTLVGSHEKVATKLAEISTFADEFNEEDYLSTEWSQVVSLISEIETTVRNASTDKEAADAIDAFKEKMDAVLSAEEILNKAKTDAKVEIENYAAELDEEIVNSMKAAIDLLVEAAKAEIDKCTTVEEVAACLSDYKAKLDAVEQEGCASCGTIGGFDDFTGMWLMLFAVAACAMICKRAKAKNK